MQRYKCIANILWLSKIKVDEKIVKAVFQIHFSFAGGTFEISFLGGNLKGYSISFKRTSASVVRKAQIIFVTMLIVHQLVHVYKNCFN